MPIAIQAGLWGFFAGTALLLGAAVAYLLPVPARLIAAMAFGGGVLISALRSI